MNNLGILLYQTEDGQSKIDVRLEDETFWLSQVQMEELFQTTNGKTLKVYPKCNFCQRVFQHLPLRHCDQNTLR